MLKVLDVDGAVRRVGGGWTATGEPWVYDADRYARVTEAREREQQAMLDYLATDGCRMAFLRDQLDDTVDGRAPEPCGRCDNCGGLTLPDRSPRPRSGAAAERLARPGVVVAPRKMWPTGLAAIGLDLKGKIADAAEEGRAVARLTDLGHGAGAARPCSEQTPRTDRCPVPLVKAVIEVLGDWQPAVTAIVVVESATRPTLVRRPRRRPRPATCRCPSSASYAIVDDSVAPGQGAINSAQRVAAVTRRYAWRPAPDAPPDRSTAPRCCSSTTRPSPAGRSPSRPATSAPPAPPPYTRLVLATDRLSVDWSYRVPRDTRWSDVARRPGGAGSSRASVVEQVGLLVLARQEERRDQRQDDQDPGHPEGVGEGRRCFCEPGRHRGRAADRVGQRRVEGRRHRGLGQLGGVEVGGQDHRDHRDADRARRSAG